jgi:hypothetical protein
VIKGFESTYHQHWEKIIEIPKKSKNIWLAATMQIVKQSTNDSMIKCSNPAATGTKEKLWKGEKD